MNRKVIIDGKSLCSNQITGIVRVHLEVIKRLDELVEPGQVELLIPEKCRCKQDFKNLKVVNYGKSLHIIWRQVFFAFYVMKHKGIALCMSNSAPIICPSIVCIHDINAVLNPDFYNTKPISKLLHLETISKFLICRNATKIFCPSNFTKKELLKRFRCKNPEIAVVNLGWEHYKEIEPNYAILDKYGLVKGTYYFSIGSLAPHKNFQWIIEAAKKNIDNTFVIAGGADPKVFGYEYTEEKLKGIKYVGYISDQESKALMDGCKAFLFPSLYEGFGIPPLEAMSVGANVIASDIPVLREVLGDAIHYIDPNDPNVNLDKILNTKLKEKREDVLNRYSWEKTARQIWNIILEYDEKGTRYGL